MHPFHLLYPIASIAALMLSQGPVRDPDVYWHVRLGGEMLRTHSVAGHASSWSLVPPSGHWTTSEWLAELMLRGFVNAFGWRGMLVFQALVTIALLALLAVALGAARDPRIRAVVFALTAVSMAPLFQARPQSLSLVFLAWLGMVCRNVLFKQRLPRLIPFLLLVLVWAQLHGLWLFAPVFLAFAGIAQLADRRDPPQRSLAKRATAYGVAGLVIGCVNPIGPRSLLLPFTLHSATKNISEWQPTTFTPYFTWGLLALVALQVVAWVRSSERVPRAEMLWTAVLVAFSLLAYRNVAVALLLLAPVVATRASRASATYTTTPRERRLLAASLAAATVIAVVVAAVGAAAIRPIPSTTPTRLAAVLDDGHPHRVLDAYNTGGAVLAFGGPKVRVGIDGRADYYGHSYIQRYDDMLQMRYGWQRLFNRLDPDAAIIDRHGPMAAWLAAHGWHAAGTQGTYELLLKAS